MDILLTGPVYQVVIRLLCIVFFLFAGVAMLTGAWLKSLERRQLKRRIKKYSDYSD
jgi:hypothetical protein